MSNLPNLSGSAIQNTFQRVLHTDGELIYNGTGSVIKELPTTSSFALTASYIETAQTASYVFRAVSASYAISASHEITYELSSSYAQTASYVETAQTASYVETAQSASYVRATVIDQPFTNITSSGEISASGTVTMAEGVSVGRFYLGGHGGSNPHFAQVAGGNIALVNANFAVSELTASGGISSSNAIEGTRLFAGGHIVAMDSGGDLALAFENNTTFLIGKSNNKIKMMGEVTASGGIVATDIKASVRFNSNEFTGTESSVQGDIIYYGTGTTVAGKLYYLKNTGAWGSADATQAASATTLLAIALGTDPATDGMLIRGIFHSPQGDLGTIADILYVDTIAGNVNRVKPSSTGQIVRVVGYVLNNTVGLMWFDPDKTWIEL